MKKILIVFIAVLLVSGCSKTKFLASWKTEEANSLSYNKMIVTAMVPSINNRANIETALVNELKKSGFNKAYSSIDYFPLAGKLDQDELGEETVKQMVKDAVRKNKVDALLIVSILDKRQELHYHEGSGLTIGAEYGYGDNYPYYSYPEYPVYEYPYYGYYYYAYSAVYRPGYYSNETTYFVECNLYDVKSEKLVWSGQTKTESPKSIHKEIEKYASLIVKEIDKQGIISLE